MVLFGLLTIGLIPGCAYAFLHIIAYMPLLSLGELVEGGEANESIGGGEQREVPGERPDAKGASFPSMYELLGPALVSMAPATLTVLSSILFAVGVFLMISNAPWR